MSQSISHVMFVGVFAHACTPWVCVCVYFHVLFFLLLFLLVWIAGRDVCPLPIAAPEEPSWLCVHHQSLTHPQLQK